MALPTTERRLRRLIDSVRLTLINAVDRQGRLTHVNDAHRQIYGVNPTGVIGQRPLAALYGADGATLHQVQNAKVFETGEMLTQASSRRSPCRTASNGASCSRASRRCSTMQGKSLEVITASIDITALKKAQAEMRRKVDRMIR